jgi:hypothetical protein
MKKEGVLSSISYCTSILVMEVGLFFTYSVAFSLTYFLFCQVQTNY